jgi:hypothetical protein
MVKYDDLIFGSYSIAVVREAVKDPVWQRFRATLHGLSTERKLEELRWYVRSFGHADMPVQVTNYVYALKRGGLLK